MADTTQKDLVANESVEVTNKTSQASKEFIGQWNQLVSTTNWDKGNIIVQWRDSLKQKKSAASQYSDEAWSQMVGGVTPQHVGRLRRTYDRFGHVYAEYDGVFWSHFYAALDWDDAEMWLEGAVQNKWSVSKMRQHRWETLGKVGEDPSENPVVASEMVEEAESLSLSESKRQNDKDYIEGPVHEGPDWGDESDGSSKKEKSQQDAAISNSIAEEAPKVRPFESLTDLPDDVMDVANDFKVAIIRHKSNDWTEISREQMLELLDALKELATASS